MERLPLADAGDRPSFRAALIGAAVIIGGSLMMTTVLGVAAIAGMVLRGESPEQIAAELPGSLELAVFVTAGGMLMSLVGGYTAATIAAQARNWHAAAAGVIATVITVVLLPVWGDSGPVWITVLSTVTISPLAVVGAWLAMPVPVLTTAAGER